MLADAEVVAFAPVTDMQRARAFYTEVLGLTAVDQGPFAVVLDANGTSVRLTPAPDGWRPVAFTVLGWKVTDIEATVDALTAKGVTFNRYDGMDQDERAIWTTPDGGRVAWFKDPEGNVLSLTEFAG
jgi:predicted enzyme related to lactoylglutathione lyase